MAAPKFNYHRNSNNLSSSILQLNLLVTAHDNVLNIVDNPQFNVALFSSFASQIVVSISFAVDTFFLLSAILIGFLQLKHLAKEEPTIERFFKSLPHLYLHRYIRQAVKVQFRPQNICLNSSNQSFDDCH